MGCLTRCRPLGIRPGLGLRPFSDTWAIWIRGVHGPLDPCRHYPAPPCFAPGADLCAASIGPQTVLVPPCPALKPRNAAHESLALCLSRRFSPIPVMGIPGYPTGWEMPHLYPLRPNQARGPAPAGSTIYFYSTDPKPSGAKPCPITRTLASGVSRGGANAFGFSLPRHQDCFTPPGHAKPRTPADSSQPPQAPAQA